MEKHFKLTSETKIVSGKTLYRIQATKDLPNGVKKGDLGGFVEKEENLGNTAWVYGNAEVYENACVSGNAYVFNNAKVYGNAQVFGDARVYENAVVYGKAGVYGNAVICGNSWVSGNAYVFDNVFVSGNSWVSGNAYIFNNARVYENASVSGDACVFDNAKVHGNSKIYGNAKLCGNAEVHRDTVLNSESGLIVITIPGRFSITVTKKLIFAGCKTFDSEKIKDITKKEAENLGLEKEFYKPYKDMVLAAIKLVK